MAEMYRRVKLAIITGWTFDVIDGLGYEDGEVLLQVWDAEHFVEVSNDGS